MANQVQAALSQMRELRTTVSSLTNCDDQIRTELLRETRALLRELETPPLLIQRICGLNVWESVTMCIASDMGLFSFVATNMEPVSAADIATNCDAELLFVQRLLRCLVVFGAVTEISEMGRPRYSATLITRTFGTVAGLASLRSTLGFLAPGWLRFPQQLAAHSYRVLESGSETVYNDVYQAPGKTLWEILGSTPYAESWGIFMDSFNSGHTDWLDYYPAHERLVEGARDSAEDIFMVDVGGCSGSQAVAFATRFPEARGKFIIQDLPDMLPRQPLQPTVAMAHDFFQPFPAQLHGARLYYMRFISHDWSQARLVQILSNIRAAMTPEYSRLIINDWILPEKDLQPFMATQDLNMMVLGGGEERSEKRHRNAVEAAGLVVTGIWDPRDGRSEGVVECQRPG